MTATDNILNTLRDLHKQATTEQSHFYVAKCVTDCIAHIEAQATRIAELETMLQTEQEFRYAGEEDLKHVQNIIGASAKLIHKYARLR